MSNFELFCITYRFCVFVAFPPSTLIMLFWYHMLTLNLVSMHMYWLCCEHMHNVFTTSSFNTCIISRVVTAPFCDCFNQASVVLLELRVYTNMEYNVRACTVFVCL